MITPPRFPEYIYCAGRKLTLIRVFNEDKTPDWADYYDNPNPVFKHEGKFHAYYL
tara:strand:- start:181 stop:345 length:165 start_codon:yes stop_codon:yes gene_type:complete